MKNGMGVDILKKLKGEDIHIYGRITAVADVFDALGSDRVYKKKLGNLKRFLNYLKKSVENILILC